MLFPFGRPDSNRSHVEWVHPRDVSVGQHGKSREVPQIGNEVRRGFTVRFEPLEECRVLVESEEQCALSNRKAVVGLGDVVSIQAGAQFEMAGGRLRESDPVAGIADERVEQE